MMSKRVFMGIDPGQGGAIAALDGDGSVILLEDWPGDEVAAAELLRAFISSHLNSHIEAAIEKVSSMPKQGVSSTFKFGMNYGVWRGIMAMAGIPFALVTPKTWQKGLVLPSDGANPKDRSLAVARRLFPKQIAKLKRKKDNGKSDALLIAYWMVKNGT